MHLLIDRLLITKAASFSPAEPFEKSTSPLLIFASQFFQTTTKRYIKAQKTNEARHSQVAILRMAQRSDILSQLCRLCLRKTFDCTPIFVCDEDEAFPDLPEIMKYCLDIEIHSDDGFTNAICQSCKTLLLTFNRFKETCQDSQLRLRRLRKQVMESRRKSEKESRVILEVSEPAKDVDIPSQEMVSDAVRPIAIWRVLQNGQLRANTANIKDEMIVSELLDDKTSTEGASIEKEVAVEKLHIQEDSRHLEHHNYCSPHEKSKDPEDRDEEETKDPEDSDIEEIKDPEDRDEEETKDPEDSDEEETTIAEEEKWIKEANEAKMMNLHLVHPFPQVPYKQPDKAESQKNEDKKYSSLALKDISGLLRIQSVDGDCKKKILISQTSRHVLRIPTLQAEPISGRNQGDAVFKVSKTLRRLGEDLELKKGGKVVKLAPKAVTSSTAKGYYKSFWLSKGNEMSKIVQDMAGKSNISLLQIKQMTSPFVTSKPSR